MGTVSSSSSGRSKASSNDSLDSPRRDARTTRRHLLTLARALNKFSIEFYQEMASSRTPATLVQSPISIALGLGTLLLGSNGALKEDIYKVLYLVEVIETETLPAFAALHWDLTRLSSSSKGSIVSVISRLFIQKGMELTEKFEELCDSYDISFPVFVDYRNRPDFARSDINHWISQKTGGRVLDFLQSGHLDRDTQMILASVACFRSQWYRQFDPKKTKRMVYTLPMREKIEVEMMHQIGIFKVGHVHKVDSDVIDIPLANGNLRMVVFLPQHYEGLDKVESKISRSLLDAAYESLQEELVDLFLPKFQFDLGSCVTDVLPKLGLKGLSSGKQDGLSRLCEKEGFRLGAAYHHVVFEVDETGGEEVSTAHLHTYKEKPTRSIKADHPFFFAVTDIRTRAIIFFGRVVRPFA